MKSTTKTKSAATTGNSKATTTGPAKQAGKQGESGSLLQQFFMEQLKDIYYAEQQILKALPEMEEACTTEELKEAFNDHLHQTQKHVKRLEKVFAAMGAKAEGKKCDAIEGIIKEGRSIIEDTKEGSMTRDAALIIAAQKVEHYEIATYGGLVQLAITMGKHEVADLLDTTLMEEEDTDRSLTNIAESHINMEAEEESADAYTEQKEKTAMTV